MFTSVPWSQVRTRTPAAGEPSVEPPRVELIEGAIVMMSPIGSRHEEIVDRLSAWSFRCLPEHEARVRIQQSLGIPGRQSVPQPDVAWGLPRDYAAQRPDATLAVDSLFARRS